MFLYSFFSLSSSFFLFYLCFPLHYFPVLLQYFRLCLPHVSFSLRNSFLSVKSVSQRISPLQFIYLNMGKKC